MTKKFYPYTSAIFLLLAISALAHPLFLSILQIDHNRETRGLELTFKLFSDDLERAVEQDGGAPLKLGSGHEAPDADGRIFRYIREHFGILIDGVKPDSVAFVGKEVDLEVTWCYVEISGVPDDFAILDITDFIFCDIAETQTNMVHVKTRGIKKSLMLDGFNYRDSLDFSEE